VAPLSVTDCGTLHTVGHLIQGSNPSAQGDLGGLLLLFLQSLRALGKRLCVLSRQRPPGRTAVAIFGVLRDREPLAWRNRPGHQKGTKEHSLPQAGGAWALVLHPGPPWPVPNNSFVKIQGRSRTPAWLASSRAAGVGPTCGCCTELGSPEGGGPVQQGLRQWPWAMSPARWPAARANGASRVPRTPGPPFPGSGGQGGPSGLGGSRGKRFFPGRREAESPEAWGAPSPGGGAR
jgi:hypothetical protein